ncbi:MAG: hypothetical protein R2828_12515 [Saprospiraceae bacterium]
MATLKKIQLPTFRFPFDLLSVLRWTVTPLVLLAFGIGVNLSVAGKGFMPLDQSILFDGGWRILSGQVPFVDYDTLHGVVPSFIQSVFFKLFGVSWFSFCLHAAFFNGLFALLVYYFFEWYTKEWLLSFVLALTSSVIFYPPFGTPYVEKHAFFFSLLAIIVAILATETIDRKKTAMWTFLIPCLLIIAYLCKQMPTLMAIPFALGILVFRSTKNIGIKLLSLGGGIIFSLAVAWSIMLILGIDPSHVFYSIWTLPSKVGSHRSAYIFDYPLASLTYFLWLPFGIRMLSSFLVHWVFILFFSRWILKSPLNSFYQKLLHLIPVALMGVLAVLAAWMAYKKAAHSQGIAWMAIIVCIVSFAGMGFLFFRGFKPEKEPVWLQKLQIHPKTIIDLLIAEGLLLLCHVFVMLTNNQFENGFPYIFVSLGICTTALLQLGSSASFIWRGREISPVDLRRYILIVFLVIGLIDAAVFHWKVNLTRIVQEIHYEKDLTASPIPEWPSEMAFMEWQMGPGYDYSQQDFAKVAHFLENQPDNFFLLGDASVLYGITHKISTSPYLWFYMGFPEGERKKAFYQDFDQKVLQNIQRYAVKWIVLEGEKTFGEISLKNFPALQQLIEKKGTLVQTFGGYQVIQLDL